MAPALQLPKTPAEQLDLIIAASDASLAAEAPAFADRLLAIGETALTGWLTAKGQEPTNATSEGFRILALHRQAARGDPSFNACRETCRELVYHYNCIQAEHGAPEASRLIRLGAMVARHLVLFLDGKLEVAGLGEFCCASRPLRTAEASAGDHL